MGSLLAFGVYGATLIFCYACGLDAYACRLKFDDRLVQIMGV